MKTMPDCSFTRARARSISTRWKELHGLVCFVGSLLFVLDYRMFTAAFFYLEGNAAHTVQSIIHLSSTQRRGGLGENKGTK